MHNIIISSIIYNIIHLLIKFVSSTIYDIFNKYPDSSFNSIQSINYRSRVILLEETFQGQHKFVCIIK